MNTTGSQIFVEVLVEQGVDTLFGYPGGAVLNLYDELYKNSDRIRHVLTAHEQGAVTRGPTATPAPRAAPVSCSATSGPGATNLVTGIATAYMDSVPMVAITGNVATSRIAAGTPSRRPVSRASRCPSRSTTTRCAGSRTWPTRCAHAFRIAQTGRKGPGPRRHPEGRHGCHGCEFTPQVTPQLIRTVYPV